MGGLSFEDKHQGRLRGVNFGIAGPSHPTVSVPITLVGAHDTRYRYRCTAALGIVGGPFRSGGGIWLSTPTSWFGDNLSQASHLMVSD
ncbi:unnamed protein product, partial [Cyprideis torosa]